MDIGVQTPCTYFEDQHKISDLRRHVKILQQQVKRRNSRIANKQKLICHLKKSNSNKGNIYEKPFGRFFLELFHNEIKNSIIYISTNNATYSYIIINFILIFYFYLFKAYDFLRTKLHC